MCGAQGFTYIYTHLHEFTHIYAYLHTFTLIYMHLHAFAHIYTRAAIVTFLKLNRNEIDGILSSGGNANEKERLVNPI